MELNRPRLSEAFGSVLKELRAKAGISQEQLALQSGLDRTHVSKIERGLRQPTLATIVQLSATLHVRPERLVKLAIRRYEAAGE